MRFLYSYLITINALTFLLMLADKRNAKKRCRRIPELVLLGSCAMGGSIGGWIGMYLFRHKTKHLSFSIGIPVILALQLAWAIMLYTML